MQISARSALRRARISTLFSFHNLTKGMFTRPAPISSMCIIDNANPLISLNSDDIEKIELCKSVRWKANLNPRSVSLSRRSISMITTIQIFSLIVENRQFQWQSAYTSPAYDKRAVHPGCPIFVSSLLESRNHSQAGEKSYLNSFQVII